MTISVAIVGAGRTGGWHVRDLSTIHDVRIVGIADVRREVAEALAASVGSAVPVFADYREMLEQIRPDVAYLCTPPIDHAEQACFAAERGINLFIEKPLATTVADARAIADAVEQRGLICAVGYQWRYCPATDAAREALGDRPVTLLAGWWYWTIPVIGWIKRQQWGGGQVFDQATHLVDLMRYFAGEVATVYAAYTRNALEEEELPNWDANVVSLRFKNGAVGSLHTTYALFPGIPEGNGLDVVARELLLRVSLRATTVFRRDATPERIPAPDGWNIDQAFIPIVRRNDRAAVRSSAQEAALTLAVTRAANYSAVTGQPVDMDQFLAAPPDESLIVPNERPVFAPAGTPVGV